LREGLLSKNTVVNHVDGEPGLFEAALDAARDRAVVFDQKESHGIRSSTMDYAFVARRPAMPSLHSKTCRRKPSSNARQSIRNMSEITINELEAAINFWRARSPSSGDELSLCKEASALSKPYALMIVQRRGTVSSDRLEAAARDAWEAYVRAGRG
jgi:hypothetical protein